MLDVIYLFLRYMKPWHILVAVGLFAGMICLLWTKPGLYTYVALFFVAETFATAADLRETVPFISFAPMFLALPLVVSMVVRKERFSLGRLACFWFLVMVFFGIRSNFSEVGTSASFWAVYYLTLLSMGMMVGTLIASPAYRMGMLRWLAYGGVATMLIGLGSIFIVGRDAYTQGRLAPFHVQANIWGPTALVAFLNCVLYFQLSRGAVRKLPQIAMLVITLLSVILSFSRGAIYALGIALIFYWMVGGMSRLKGIVVGGLLFLAVAGAFKYGSGRDKFDPASASRLLSYTSESRVELEMQLIRTVVMPHPLLGIGFYGGLHAEKVGIKRGDPHNSFLLLWMEQGTIGLMIVLLLILGNFAACRRIIKTWPKGSVENNIGRFCRFALLAVLLDGVTIGHLWTHHAMLGVEFAILTGMISSLNQLSKYEVPEEEIEFIDEDAALVAW